MTDRDGSSERRESPRNSPPRKPYQRRNAEGDDQSFRNAGSRPTSARPQRRDPSPEHDRSSSARGAQHDGEPTRDRGSVRPVRRATESTRQRGQVRSGPSRFKTSRSPAPLTPEQRQRQVAAERAKKKGWGSVARKGAINITSTGQALVDAKSQSRTPDPIGSWESAERPVVRRVDQAKAKARATYALPGDVAASVRKSFIGTAYMREKMIHTLTRAAEAYDRKRYEEALRLGRVVADATPGVAAVRELTGLAAYRAERWAMAKIHLRAHFTISGSPEHLPLVMDADRANHRYRAVE
ncbi:MAG: hypothetical protein ACYCPT_13480, partial [Acidimicrobiales bacterium]